MKLGASSKKTIIYQYDYLFLSWKWKISDWYVINKT